MDMFLQDNLSDLARNMGFSDEDIIWLYGYFTDLKIAPTTYTVKDLEKEIPYDITRREINGKVVKLFCTKEDIFTPLICVKRVKILSIVWKKYRVVA